MSTNIEKSCFSIVVRNQENEIVDRGTGFFINNEGNFITAAHVVGNTTHRFFALIGKEIPMYIKFHEYQNQHHYESDVYQDLAFGKIDCQPADFIKLSAEKLLPSDPITINGFNKHVPATLAKNLDELDELEIDEYDRFYNSYPTTIDHVPVAKINKEKGTHFVMSNVYTFTPVNEIVKGLSGGPIVHNDICYGILNTATESVTSVYIIEQLTKTGISFTIG